MTDLDMEVEERRQARSDADLIREASRLAVRSDAEIERHAREIIRTRPTEDRWAATAEIAARDCLALLVREQQTREALEAIEPKQRETLAMLKRNGFVFTHIGNEPGNWQHLAFTLYTEICEIDTIVRSVLDEDEALAAGRQEPKQ